jgi:hypothetical protein
MPYVCPICKLFPSSHSFTKLSEKKDIIYYYTCPAKARLYYDVEGILQHYNGILSEHPPHKKYIWILDGADFSLTHALQINVAREIIQLISNKYSDNLEKIIVINSGTFVWMIYNTILPFLNDHLKKIIVFHYEYTTLQEIILFESTSE